MKKQNFNKPNLRKNITDRQKTSTEWTQNSKFKERKGTPGWAGRLARNAGEMAAGPHLQEEKLNPSRKRK